VEADNRKIAPYIVNADYFQKYHMSDKMLENMECIDYDSLINNENDIKKYYKGLRLRKKYRQLFESDKKILVKMSATPGTIDCISAALDESCSFPNHSFFVIASKDENNYPPELICALLNSDIINAYVRMNCVKRTLLTTVIRSAPIPKFNSKQKEQIVDLVHRITENNHEKLEKQINNIICDAFGLDEHDKNELTRYCSIYRGIYVKSPENRMKDEKYEIITGMVEKVDVNERKCWIYLMEYDMTKDFSITQNMPGWFLRKNAQFSGKLYKSNDLKDIKPLMYSFMNDDEVIDYLDEIFSSPYKEGE
ncbi:MAG: TaqI-like C-terminal specificity domain-containing protein, partial [Lachnospiraceae bacterium]|nr:TaqI-like C-terminal specificity domain-containing protein [Lachnospiraceae bacterium]